MYNHVVEKYRSYAFNLDQFGVSGFLHVKEIHVLNQNLLNAFAWCSNTYNNSI